MTFSSPFQPKPLYISSPEGMLVSAGARPSPAPGQAGSLQHGRGCVAGRSCCFLLAVLALVLLKMGGQKRQIGKAKSGWKVSSVLAYEGLTLPLSSK